MRPPAYLIKKGVGELPCIGDGRQSGTSGSPSILNASPEAAAGGGLALLRSGDRIRIDMNKCTADILISDDELVARRDELAAQGGFASPESQSCGSNISVKWCSHFLKAWSCVMPPTISQLPAPKVPRDNH